MIGGIGRIEKRRERKENEKVERKEGMKVALSDKQKKTVTK